MAILPNNATVCLKLIKNIQNIMASSKPIFKMEKELVDFLKRELNSSYDGTQYHQTLLYLLSGKAANNRDLMDLCHNLSHQFNKLLEVESKNPYSEQTTNVYVRLHYFRRKLNTEVQKLL